MKKIYISILIFSFSCLFSLYAQEVKIHKGEKLGGYSNEIGIYKIFSADSFNLYHANEASGIEVPVFQSNSNIPFNFNLLIKSNINHLIDVPYFNTNYAYSGGYLHVGYKKIGFGRISVNIDYEDLNGDGDKDEISKRVSKYYATDNEIKGIFGTMVMEEYGSFQEDKIDGMEHSGKATIKLYNGTEILTFVFYKIGYSNVTRSHYQDPPGPFYISRYYRTRGPMWIIRNITDNAGNQMVYEYEETPCNIFSQYYENGIIANRIEHSYAYVNKINLPDGESITITYRDDDFSWEIPAYGNFRAGESEGNWRIPISFTYRGRDCNLNYEITNDYAQFYIHLSSIDLPNEREIKFNGDYNEAGFRGAPGYFMKSYYINPEEFEDHYGDRDNVRIDKNYNPAYYYYAETYLFHTNCFVEGTFRDYPLRPLLKYGLNWEFEEGNYNISEEESQIAYSTAIINAYSGRIIDYSVTDPRGGSWDITNTYNAFTLNDRNNLDKTMSPYISYYLTQYISYTLDDFIEPLNVELKKDYCKHIQRKHSLWQVGNIETDALSFDGGNTGQIPEYFIDKNNTINVAGINAPTELEDYSYCWATVNEAFLYAPQLSIYEDLTGSENFLPGINESDNIRYNDRYHNPYTERIYYENDEAYDQIDILGDGNYGTQTEVTLDFQSSDQPPIGLLYGLVKCEIDTLGNKTYYDYYRENDPDGQPRKLKKIIKDKATLNDAGEVENTITLVEYKYNDKGFVSEKTEHNPSGTYTTKYLYYGIDDLSGYGLTGADGNFGQLAVVASPDPENAAEERVYKYKYNSSGQKKYEMDPEGNTQEWTYFNTGIWMDYLETYKDPKGQTYTYSYQYVNKHLIKTEETTVDTVTLTTIREYDENGDLIKTTYPDSTFEAYTRDAEGFVTEHIDRRENTTEYDLTKSGWVKTRTVKNKADVQLSKVSYVYNKYGEVIKETEEGADESVYYAYHPWGWGMKIKESYDPDFEYTEEHGYPYEWYFNTEGLTTKETDRKGNTVFHNVKLNEYGNILSYEKPFTNTQGNPDKIRKTFEYDKFGNRVVASLDMDTAPDRENSTSLNIAGEVNTTGDNEFTTSYVKDKKGRTVAVKKGRKAVCTLFDKNGNVEEVFTCASSIISDPSDVKTVTSKHVVRENTYDALGRLVYTKDDSGEKIAYRYDTMGRITGIQTGAAGEEFNEAAPFTEIVYSVDTSGNEIVTSTTDQGEVYVTKTDASGKTLTETVNNLETKYFYYDDGKLKWVVDPACVRVTDDETGSAESVNPLRLYTYDTQDRLTHIYRGYADYNTVIDKDMSEAIASEMIVHYTYDENSNIETVTDANSNVVARNSFDELNRQTSTLDQEDRVIGSEQNKAGETVELEDTQNNATAYYKTDSGLPQSRVLPNGATVSNSYTPDEGWIASNSDAAGSGIYYSWSDIGLFNGLAVSKGSGVQGVTARTVTGRDGLDRITSVQESQPDGNVATGYTYKPDHSLISSETTAVGSFSKTVSYSYDSDSRLSTITYPTGKVVTLVYNNQGYIGSKLLNSETLVTYTYDSNGSIISKDLNTDLIEKTADTDFRGYLYKEIANVNGSPVNEKVYHRHPDGRVDYISNMQDPAASYKFGYNNLNWLTSVKRGTLENGDIPTPDYEELYEYDIMGNLISWTIGSTQGESTSGTYAPFSMTDEFSDNAIDPAYAVMQGNWWEHLDKLSTAFTNLSDISLITEQKDVRTFSTVAELAPGRLYEPVAVRMYFGYDSPSSYRYAGLRSMAVVTEGENQGDPKQIRRLVTFEIGMVYGGSEIICASEDKMFDLAVKEFSLDLTIADTTEKTASLEWEAGTETGTVTHDLGYIREGKAGFLVSKNENAFHVKFQNVSISGKELESDPYNVRKVYQYTTFNGKACVWDANGNLIQYGANDNFSYDAFNRMTEANDVKYLYDAQNRRVAKIDGADTWVYIYHGWSVIAEYKNGVLQREFIEGISTDEHLCMIDYTQDPAGEKYYYILNTRNGVEKIVDSAGEVVEYYEYTAYGEATIFDNQGTPISDPISHNPYRFQGRRYDEESGMMYFRNRQYSPEMKRFISMDPMGYVDSMNLYETFGCDPVNNTDRWGLTTNKQMVLLTALLKKRLRKITDIFKEMGQLESATEEQMEAFNKRLEDAYDLYISGKTAIEKQYAEWIKEQWFIFPSKERKIIIANYSELPVTLLRGILRPDQEQLRRLIDVGWQVVEVSNAKANKYNIAYKTTKGIQITADLASLALGIGAVAKKGVIIVTQQGAKAMAKFVIAQTTAVVISYSANSVVGAFLKQAGVSQEKAALVMRGVGLLCLWKAYRAEYKFSKKMRGFKDKEWNKAREEYWKAVKGDKYAPRREALVQKRGKIIRVVQKKHLHHKTPRRNHPPYPHDPKNLREVWPEEHEKIDKYYHTGYKVIKYFKK